MITKIYSFPLFSFYKFLFSSLDSLISEGIYTNFIFLLCIGEYWVFNEAIYKNLINNI